MPGVDGMQAVTHAQRASEVAGRFSRPAVIPVLHQHLDDCIGLRNTRTVLVRSPRVRLHQLARTDERIAAHLSGLFIAGPDGDRLAAQALVTPDAGSLFACTVLALQDDDPNRFARLCAVAEAEPDALRGLVSALGWVSSRQLTGKLAAFLPSRSSFQRSLKLAACAVHRIDPGVMLDAALTDADPKLAMSALRIAGLTGRLDLLSACVEALHAVDPEMRYQAARAALLLGDRHAAVDGLEALAVEQGPRQRDALRLVVKVIEASRVAAILRTLGNLPARRRLVIEAVGMAGLAQYVPWLIEQMAEPALARIAADAFTALTGADLAALDLEAVEAPKMAVIPSEDAEDEAVAMDEDDGLSYPDVERVARWWADHAARFQAPARWFLGAPNGTQHCMGILRTGTQPQRSEAADHLSLLRPGAPSFNVAAPAWRQQRLLDGIPG